MIAIPYEFAKDMSDGGHYADWQFRKTVIELDVTDWDISRRTSLKNFFAECVNLKVDKLTTIILPRYMKDDEKLTKQITHSLHREVDIVF